MNNSWEHSIGPIKDPMLYESAKNLGSVAIMLHVWLMEKLQGSMQARNTFAELRQAYRDKVLARNAAVGSILLPRLVEDYLPEELKARNGATLSVLTGDDLSQVGAALKQDFDLRGEVYLVGGKGPAHITIKSYDALHLIRRYDKWNEFEDMTFEDAELWQDEGIEMVF